MLFKEKMMGLIGFFYTSKYPWGLQIQITLVKGFDAIIVKYAEKTLVGSHWALLKGLNPLPIIYSL